VTQPELPNYIVDYLSATSPGSESIIHYCDICSCGLKLARDGNQLRGMGYSHWTLAREIAGRAIIILVVTLIGSGLEIVIYLWVPLFTCNNRSQFLKDASNSKNTRT
jgi:hypothetical protein